MKLKVDENIGRGGIDFLRQHGHDTLGVHEQGSAGKPTASYSMFAWPKPAR